MEPTRVQNSRRFAAQSARHRPGNPPLLRLAIPAIVGLLSGTLMGVVDTLVIAPLGTDALAATSLATSVLIIVYSGLLGPLSVVAVAMAQAHGARDRRALGAHVTNGLALATLAALTVGGATVLAFPGFSRLTPSPAVLNALFSYWRAMAAMTVPYALLGVFHGLYNGIDRPWVAVCIGLAGVGKIIPLNWLPIYEADLGLLGSGLASLAAKSMTLLVAI